MSKKALAVLVILSFMVSNICYAVPAANSVPNSVVRSTVDNMALRSVLKGEPADLARVTALFETLLRQQLGDNQRVIQEAMDMWKSNLQEVKAEDDHVVAGDLKIAVMSDTQIKITLGTETRYISVGEEGLTVDTQQGDVAKYEALPGEKALSKEEQAKGLQALRDEGMKSYKPATDDERKAIIEEVKEILKAAVEAGRIQQQEMDKIITEIEGKEIGFIDAVAIDQKKFFISHGTPNQIILPRGMKPGASRGDLALHENLEGSTMAHDDILKEQERIHGDRSGVMEETRQEIKRLKNEALAKAADKTPADAMAEEVTLERDAIEQAAEPNATEAQKKTAADSIRKAAQNVLPAEDQSTLAKASDDSVIQLGLDAINKALAAIFKKVADVYKTFMQKANSLTNENLVIDRVKEVLDKGEKLGFYKETLVRQEQGRWVPTFAGAQIFEVLNRSKAKAGSLNIIDAGADSDAITNDLSRIYPDLFEKGIAKIYTGKEQSMIDTEKLSPKQVTVLFTDENAIDNVNGVSYIKVTNVDRADGLKLLLMALAPRVDTLSADEQAALDEITQGNFIVPNVEIADENTYDAMQEDYTELVNLFIQA